MDDFAHRHCSYKRKADGEDGPDPSSDPPDARLVDREPLRAPRLLLPADTQGAMWPSTSPTTPTSLSPVSQVTYPASQSPLTIPEVPYPPSSATTSKRPRLEKTHPAATRLPLRRSPRKHASSARSTGLSPPPPRRSRRLGGDIPDTGIVPSTSPGPTTGSLLRVTTTVSATKLGQNLPSPLPSNIIDLSSPHIPSPTPLINRQTLKELDLEAILRNPQLRHDLLFDSGLQFRPTSNRRKREMAENYWNAITRELESGCTCVSFDPQGKPHDLVCACGKVSLPPVNPILAISAPLQVLTLRMPSRILPLLKEFLEVLLSVIQPLSSISGMYVNPNTFQAQMQEHAAQAAYMRSVFDPELIEQELKHGLFDPSGLFQTIGRTLKSHCAPMRDRAVEAMIAVAQTCAPGGSGTKADAVKAVRMCMDILELMKLDIANHQLQTLRPLLIRTSGQFELKTFKARKFHGTLRITQEWLRAAHQDLLACDHPIPDPSRFHAVVNYRLLQRNQQAYISVLRALTDLVFAPPSPIPPHSVPHLATPQSQHGVVTVISALPGYPETSYLDNVRLVVLSTDAADATTLCMFLLLYRQLVYSDLDGYTRTKHQITQEELLKLKREIRDIAGCQPSREKAAGDSTDSSGSKQDRSKDVDRWRSVKQDLILQIAMRAKEAQTRATSPKSPSSLEEGRLPPTPDERMLRLAERWSDSNMQPGSPLSCMLKTRLRDVVFNGVVSLSYPPRDSMTGKFPTLDLAMTALGGEASSGAATGMEPLAEEIRSLAERLSRLALIHLNAYLPLYEQHGFLDS